MKIDRELLELAYKALMHGADLNADKDMLKRWNPLTDDGDALRLAVKLQIQVTPGTYNKDEFTAFHAGRGEAHEYIHFQKDEFAATRRAIVRAAAAIGEAM